MTMATTTTNIVVFVLLLLQVVAFGLGLPTPSEKPKLRFTNDGRFKIVNFADLHYGEFPGTDRGRFQDGNSSLVMTNILQYERPDLVVLTGDLVTGDVLVVNPMGYIDTLLQPMVTGNYKWAATYGNHDNGLVITRDAIFRTESKYDGSYTQDDGTDALPGLTNNWLPIYQPTRAPKSRS